MIKYYPNVISHITNRIHEVFPDAKPFRDQENIPGHLLWMMEEMQNFDQSKAAKRGRWTGWVIAHAEMLGLLTNQESRDLAEKDSDGGWV